MMKQVDWFERKFEFWAQQNIMPSIIERLEGTSLRISDKLSRITPEKHRIKPGEKWSILEHVGHLADLEPLWFGRLEDILHGLKEMRPADLTNKKTNEANHNDKSVSQLIGEFQSLRNTTINRLKNLTDEEVFKSALHPRLKTPMRMIDLFTFVADHDDHHLVKITESAEAG
jgi:uncharacterized damage-inducible protein DinB